MVDQYTYLDKKIEGKIIKITSTANCFNFKLHEEVYIVAKHDVNERYCILKNPKGTTLQYGYIDKDCLRFYLIDKILKQL